MKNFKFKPLSASPNLPLIPNRAQAGEKHKNFVRVKENFVCGNCGYEVTGDGYTDHCPVCLWGKHVDEAIPGDRASDCGGLMEPVKTKYLKDKFRIVYKCQKCNHEFEVREGEGDNRELLVSMVR